MNCGWTQINRLNWTASIARSRSILNLLYKSIYAITKYPKNKHRFIISNIQVGNVNHKRTRLEKTCFVFLLAAISHSLVCKKAWFSHCQPCDLICLWWNALVHAMTLCILLNSKNITAFAYQVVTTKFLFCYASTFVIPCGCAWCDTSLVRLNGDTVGTWAIVTN